METREPEGLQSDEAGKRVAPKPAEQRRARRENSEEP
jgi:hypothetical protein